MKCAARKENWDLTVKKALPHKLLVRHQCAKAIAGEVREV